jgi:hypothetical protein
MLDDFLRIVGGLFLFVIVGIYALSALFSPIAVVWLFFNH